MHFSFKRGPCKAVRDIDIEEAIKATFVKGLPVYNYLTPFGKIWLQQVDGVISATRFYHIKIKNRFTFDFDAPGRLYACIVLGGEFVFRHEGRSYSLPDGHCCFIHLTKHAKSINVEPCHCSMIHFTITKRTFNTFLSTAPALQEYISQLKNEQRNIEYLPLGKMAKQVQHIIQDICCSFTTHINGQLFLEAKRYELLVALLRVISQPEEAVSTSVHFKRMEDVRFFIESNLDAELSLTKLAKRFGLSMTQLRKLFKACYDLSIGRFILEKRMAQAFYLLAQTGLSVGQIAMDVGYLHLSSFCRAYKSFYRASPLNHRKGNP